MSLDSRLESLELQHTRLEETLNKELRKPSTDPARLAKLKREKLKLKDEIHSLRTKAA